MQGDQISKFGHKLVRQRNIFKAQGVEQDLHHAKNTVLPQDTATFEL